MKNLFCIQTHPSDTDNKVFSPSVTQPVIFTHKQLYQTCHKFFFCKGTGQGWGQRNEECAERS